MKNAKLNGRDCSHFQVVHPIRREGIRYHMASVLVDNELQVPVDFASYGWPKQQGGQPLLLEEYMYSNIQLDVGLSDNDFERSNPEYGFRVHRTGGNRSQVSNALLLSSELLDGAVHWSASLARRGHQRPK